MSSKSTAVLSFAVVAMVLLVGRSAWAQAAPAAGKVAYSVLPISDALKPLDPALVEANEAAAVEDAKRARDRSAAYNNARKVFAGQIPVDDAGKRILDTWYKGYFLPYFTAPEARGQLPELRDTLLNKDLRTARSAAAVAHVRAQVLTYMKAFAQSPQKFNFHPAVRYNAMLVIGSLNAVEYGARYANDQKATVPHPLPEALDLLIAEFKSPTQIDAVRVAALIGIDRHAKLNVARPAIAGDKKKAIVDEMIALLQSPPPAGRTAEGHAWMQRRAIDILAALGMVGAYPDANVALEKIVMDNQAPISLRCTASEALAQWVPNAKAKIDASSVSRNLGLIAVKACKDELDRIAALETEEKEMERLRELIKKPNPVASGQIGAAPGAGGEMSMEMYGGGAEGPGMQDQMMDESMYGGMEGMGSMYGGMYGPGMMGGAEAVPTDPRIVWSQRRLKYQLTCVKRGLQGMAIAGKASPHEPTVTKVAKAVDAALALTDPPEDKPDLEGMAESIRKGVSQLAFLSPEAAEISADPITELPGAELPVDDASAVPAGPAANPPAAAAAIPGADPAALPVDDPAAAPGALPPGIE